MSGKTIALLAGLIVLLGVGAAAAIQLGMRAPPERSGPVPIRVPPSEPSAPRAPLASAAPGTVQPAEAHPAPSPAPAPEQPESRAAAPEPPPPQAEGAATDAVARAASSYADRCLVPITSRLGSGEAAPEFSLRVRFDATGHELSREVRPVVQPSQENPTQADPGSEATQKARSAVQECIAGMRDLPPLGVPPRGEPFEVLVPLSAP